MLVPDLVISIVFFYLFSDPCRAVLWHCYQIHCSRYLWTTRTTHTFEFPHSLSASGDQPALNLQGLNEAIRNIYGFHF